MFKYIVHVCDSEIITTLLPIYSNYAQRPSGERERNKDKYETKLSRNCHEILTKLSQSSFVVMHTMAGMTSNTNHKIIHNYSYTGYLSGTARPGHRPGQINILSLWSHELVCADTNHTILNMYTIHCRLPFSTLCGRWVSWDAYGEMHYQMDCTCEPAMANLRYKYTNVYQNIL